MTHIKQEPNTWHSHQSNMLQKEGLGERGGTEGGGRKEEGRGKDKNDGKILNILTK